MFASAREIVGESSVEIDVECNTSQELILNCLCDAYPSLASSKSSLSVAVNKKYLRGNESIVLKEGDEVAIIPPISGG